MCISDESQKSASPYGDLEDWESLERVEETADYDIGFAAVTGMGAGVKACVRERRKWAKGDGLIWCLGHG